MKILLVENAFELRVIFQKMLVEHLGDVEIDQESDGDEAFTLYCRRGPYDLVLTDNYHEGLDGNGTAALAGVQGSLSEKALRKETIPRTPPRGC